MHDSNSCSVVVITQLNLIGVNLSKKNQTSVDQSQEEEGEREKKMKVREAIY